MNNIESLQKKLDMNIALSKQYYNREKLVRLSESIADALKDFASENKQLLMKDWQKADITTRKQFIINTLNILFEKFPSDEKPLIYFPEQEIPMISAAFFSKNLHPRYVDTVKSMFGSDKTAFVFTGDLSGYGILGQIVHEFTHYLQSIVHEFTHYLQSVGKSSVPFEVLKQAGEIYAMPFDVADSADADEQKIVEQIYHNSILEQEAEFTGEYVKKLLYKDRFKQGAEQIKNTANQNNLNQAIGHKKEFDDR